MSVEPRSSVPARRIEALSHLPARPDGAYVLYWMSAARRPEDSFGLDRALDWAIHLGRPLVVLEVLDTTYAFASDRLHRFVLDGMRDNAAALAAAGVAYLPYVEPEPRAGPGLIEALEAAACVVVADRYPSPAMTDALGAAARRAPVRFEAIDGCGLLPVWSSPTAWPTAFVFRRFLQQNLAKHLDAAPDPDPLRRAAALPRAGLPADVLARWPAAAPDLLAGDPAALARLPIDHAVPPSPIPGGPRAAAAALDRFVSGRLSAYAETRDHPDDDATSGLSPYLSHGHVSAHRVFRAVADAEGWDPSRLGKERGGHRAGWWGMTPSAEAFLDQLVTWRELGYNMALLRPEAYDNLDGLPHWARATLEAHAADPRDFVYPREALEAGDTHDPVWDAAQRQLRREGRIHTYLRMLWGKKVLLWSRTPEEAAAHLVHLNDRWALDGRDPNSYSGIFWCLGRYDRPWGPERPVIGTVRFMTSANTMRKVRAKAYLKRYLAVDG